MLVIPSLSSGFKHRRIHSPTPLDMWAPKKATAPAPRPSLDLTSPPQKAALPLTPPLTPASTRRTNSDARSSGSFEISPFDSYSYRELEPVSAHTHEFPTYAHVHVPEQNVLPSPTSPTRPRALSRVPDPQPASRFLFVSGVPKDASSQGLKHAFTECGDLKGIFVRFQAEHGAIVLAFYDVRHTIRAHRQINTRAGFFDGAHLQARFISADELRDLIGQSNFVSANDGALRIATSSAGPGGELDAPALQSVLASFGELRVFRVVDPNAKAYHAEFFDARDATSALGALDGRVVLRERLHLAPYTPASASPPPSPPPALPLPAPPSPPAQNSIPFPTSPRRRLSVDSLPASPPPAAHHHERRTSNIYHFDSVGKPAGELRTPPRPRSISVASEAAGLGLVPGEAEQQQQRDAAVPDYAPELFFMAPPAPTPAPAPASVPRGRHAHVDMPPERNKIDIERIERGDDTRTTVMIKNIPNKMSDRHLIEFINDVCPRKIDFLYLRMDFTNGCNVGYAFVNFIRVEDLLHFAKAKLGTKWNLFSSEKILGMSYANCTGKEALIDKFRSSSIMDQREAWRPKLFYSAGPRKGLPEDFPAPTHLRRKERAGQLPSDLHQARALFHSHMRSA